MIFKIIEKTIICGFCYGSVAAVGHSSPPSIRKFISNSMLGSYTLTYWN